MEYRIDTELAGQAGDHTGEVLVNAMTVHELAGRADVAPHVVRYYTRIGLLHPKRHRYNGYKLFTDVHLHRLYFIRKAQSLGFTLSEIGEIFEEAGRDASPCPRVREIMQRRISENRRKLKSLMQLQKRMEKALKVWEELPDGIPDGDSVCHLIESSGKG